jgi:hypothetical protein
VANTLEAEWNDKLRALAKARDDRERERRDDRVALDETIRGRLVAMTTDFKKLWADATLPNRDRKRLLAHPRGTGQNRPVVDGSNPASRSRTDQV